MPEPGREIDFPRARAVAVAALAGGLIISALKFALFAASNSAAVLSDALESLVNIAAAVVMLVTLIYADRPPDREHRYGHGNAQFLAIAFEGAMVLLAGVGIIVEAGRRLVRPAPVAHLDLTLLGLVGIGALVAALGAGVFVAGRRLNNRVLRADGAHLLTDLATTAGALVGLGLVRLTGLVWIDTAAAAVLGAVVLITGWRLVGESVAGLMDRADPADLARVASILDEERRAGAIAGFHKLRVRRTGRFPWVDMHLQVDGRLTVAQAHDLASRIEGRIERALGGGDATAHVEPADPNDTAPVNQR
ncbi:MAG: cation transporter [Planctomycetota bacterium]|nr:MAG: cation transporter [Planctomycetota bacterium]